MFEVLGILGGSFEQMGVECYCDVVFGQYDVGVVGDCECVEIVEGGYQCQFVVDYDMKCLVKIEDGDGIELVEWFVQYYLLMVLGECQGDYDLLVYVC